MGALLGLGSGLGNTALNDELSLFLLMLKVKQRSIMPPSPVNNELRQRCCNVLIKNALEAGLIYIYSALPVIHTHTHTYMRKTSMLSLLSNAKESSVFLFVYWVIRMQTKFQDF